ncbi:MAG TPA: hypothetical protein VFX92_04525 [Candidatus Krumholzibacteria bacterium]|nr:hypothetical protein [Candidatus Krumholzibacteria bacterium]
MKRFALACIAISALAGAAPARADSSTGGAFILPGYGARAWGMAGAVSAVIDDESALDWNPARISLAARSLGASYVNLVPGASLGQAQLAFVMPLSQPANGVATHAVGAMFSNLSADIAGGTSYSENHLRAVYAYTPQPLVSVAIAGQAFFSRGDIGGFDAWGTSVDFAGRLSLSKNWDLGAVGKDMFSRYSFDDGRDSHKETSVVLGIATRRIPMVTLSADVVRQYASWTRALFGFETVYLVDHLALRGGLAMNRAGESRTAVSFGASLRAWNARLVVHYGATLDDETAFGTTHRVSLGVRM